MSLCLRERLSFPLLRFGHQLPQHKWQNTAVAVVVDFDGGVDAEFDGLLNFGAVFAGDGEGDILAGLDAVAEAGDVVGFGAVEGERLSADAFGELEREDSHADEVGAVDAFEALGDDGFDSEEARAFGCPVAARAGAVFLSGEDDERGTGGLVCHAGVVDAHLLAGRLVDRESAFDAGAVGFRGDHEVFDADIGECAAGQDAVSATTAAVAVEIRRCGSVFDGVFCGGRAGVDGAGGRDVVSRDRVAEDAHRAGAFDVGDRSGGHAEVLEEGRFLDVGALAVPIVDLADAGWHFVPLRILVCEAGVEFLENLGLEGGLHFVADFLEAWPDVFQENINAGVVLGDGFLGEVDVHAASERAGDDERWRHEEIGADVLVNAGLEVAVAREDSGSDEVVFHNGAFDLGCERAGVADTGRASVADDLEAELVKVGLEAGGLEVILHNAGAGSE